MNKKVFRLLFTFVLMIGLASYAMLDLYSYRQEIVMQSKIIEGEKIADSNIKLNLTIFSLADYYIGFMKTSFRPNELDKPTNKFIYDYEGKYPLEIWNENNAFNINGSSGTNLGSNENISEQAYALEQVSDAEFIAFEFQQKIFKDMVTNNETNKTVKAKDYLEYLPIKFYANKKLINNNFREKKDRYGEHNFRLDDYFKFPVNDDMEFTCMIKYQHNKHNNRFDLDTKLDLLGKYSEDDYLYYFMSTYDNNEDKLFLAFEDGNNYKIPEKYKGVFALNLQKEADKEIDNEIIYKFDTKEIKQAYKPKENERILQLLFNKANELAVLSQIENVYKITYLDKDSLKVINSAEITYPNENESFKLVRIGQNGLIVISSKQNFTWLDDKSHQILLQGKLNQDLSDYNASTSYYESEFDYIFADDKLYTLECNSKLARLGIITKQGYQNIVEYTFPLKKTANELKNNSIGKDSFYRIQKAYLSLGGNNEK